MYKVPTSTPLFDKCQVFHSPHALSLLKCEIQSKVNSLVGLMEAEIIDYNF